MTSFKRMSSLAVNAVFFAMACLCFVPSCAFTQCKGESCSWHSDSNGSYLLFYNERQEPVRVYVKNKEDIHVISDAAASDSASKIGTSAQTAQNSAAVSPQKDFLVYYSLLDSREKEVYAQIYEAILNKNDDLTVYGDWQEGIFKVAWAVLNDHPEIFWVEQNVKVSHYYGGERNRSVLSFKYHQFPGSLESARKKFESEAQIIIDQASRLGSDFEKERFVHDYFIQNTKYDLNCQFSDSAYSALVNKVSLCDGFARAFQYIMNRLGIQAWYVPGKAENEHGAGEHAWNQIRINGACYNVDVTFDRLADDEERGNYLTLPVYYYFNQPDSKFKKQNYVHDSALDREQVKLPACEGRFSYSQVFKDGVGFGYYREFGLSSQSIIRSMDDFYAAMRVQCREADKPVFKAYFVVMDDAVAAEITKLPIETAKEKFAREAYQGNLRDYEFYSIETTKEGIGENLSLIYLRLKYRKLK